jgi:hypothetical protein
MNKLGHSRGARLQAILSAPHYIVLGAFIVRIAYLGFAIGTRSPWLQPELHGFETVQIATSLATGKGFSSPLAVYSGPTAWLTPIFPYLLAGVFKVFGVATLGAEIAIKLLDCAFSSLVCAFLVAIGRRFSLPTIGILSAWFWAFLPMSVVVATFWVWDTSLSALCLTFLLWMTYKMSDCDNSAGWAGFGACWAFAALTNHALLAALPGLAGFSALTLRQKSGRAVRNGAIALLAFLACMTPWIIRNEIVFKGKVALRSNFALELWLGNNPQVADLWAPWLHPANDPKELKKFLRLGEVAYMQEKSSLALQFIRTHPAETFQYSYLRFMTNWTGGDNYLNDLTTSLPLKFRINMLLNSALSLLAFAGIWLLYRTYRAAALPFVWILLFYPLVYYITHPSPRYRSPIDPCLAFLAVYAVQRAAQRLWVRDTGRLIAPATIEKVHA